MQLKQLQGGCLLIMALGFSACGKGGGGGVTITSVQGKVTQGPVEKALIFADRLSTGTPSALDPTELNTTTGADGKFTLNVPDNYGDYRLISQGGTDTLTQKPAMQMFAPSGAGNVTPLTTLVALATTPAQRAALIAIIEATGVKFDADISINATPAALLLSKSIESVIETLGKAINPENKLTPAQLSDIQQKTMAAIADSIASQDPKTPFTSATLQSAIFTGVKNGLTSLPSSDGITVSPAGIQTIATAVSNLVTTIANSISASGNFSTTTTVTEDKQFQGTQSIIDTAVTNAAITVASPTAVLTSASTDLAITGPITVKFSKDISPATINSTTFTVNGVTGAVTYDIASKTATFTPTAALSYFTSYTATLTSGITDTTGIALTPAALTFRTVAAPVAPPAVVLSSASASLAVNSPITVLFSKDMTAATITSTSFKINGVTGTVSYDSASKTATFKPAASLSFDTVYTVTLTGDITDTTGLALAPASLTFRTVVAPPTVVLTGASSLTGTAINLPITVVFSRTMNAATITATTFKIGGVTGAVTYNSATNTATFTHATNLAYSTTYTVTLTSGITDTAGIALVPATLTFATVAIPLTGSTGSSGTGANF